MAESSATKLFLVSGKGVDHCKKQLSLAFGGLLKISSLVAKL